VHPTLTVWHLEWKKSAQSGRTVDHTRWKPVRQSFCELSRTLLTSYGAPQSRMMQTSRLWFITNLIMYGQLWNVLWNVVLFSTIIVHSSALIRPVFISSTCNKVPTIHKDCTNTRQTDGNNGTTTQQLTKTKKAVFPPITIMSSRVPLSLRKNALIKHIDNSWEKVKEAFMLTQHNQCKLEKIGESNFSPPVC